METVCLIDLICNYLFTNEITQMKTNEDDVLMIRLNGVAGTELCFFFYYYFLVLNATMVNRQLFNQRA